MTISAPRRRRRRQRQLLLAAVAVAITLALTVFRTSSHPVIVPKAFGQNGKCYYVRSAQEATELQAAGRCPAATTAAPMPQDWLILYYPFYNSPYYYDSFVAPAQQSGYSRYMQTFDEENADQIEQEAPTATYVDSDGDEVSGAKAGVSSDDTSIGDDESSSSYVGNSGSDSGDDNGDDDNGNSGGSSGGDDDDDDDDDGD